MNDEKEFDELLNVYYESCFKINDIYRVWSRKHGIQDTVLFVLYVIKKGYPYCTQNEICNKLAMPKQTVSLILSGLEKDGYIFRELNTKDRRNKIVKLTERGEQFSTPILEELKLAEIESFRSVSQEKRKVMIESFRLLTDLLIKGLSH